MPNFPLQDMIAGCIKTASAKLASEKEPKKVENLLAFEKKEHGGHLPSVKEEKDGCMKTASALASSDHVEKLASAVEYLATHLEDIEPAGPIARAMAKVAMKPGAGGGTAGGKSIPSPVHASGLETTQAIGGKQKYTKNKAKGEQAEDEHSEPLEHAPGLPHDGKSKLHSNYHHAPGDNSGSVPKTEYPKKGPLVNGPSGSHDKGKHNGAHEKAANAGAAALEHVGQLAKAHPHIATGVVGGALGAAGGAAGAGDGHRMGGALKGGLVGGAMGTGMSHARELHAPKLASADAARQHILMKLAGEDVMKASISGGGTTSPLAGKGQLKSMKAGETSPTQGGGPVNSEDGNAGGKHVDSNRAAIDYTKRDAKKLVVAPLKEILDQPAFSEKHDNKLQENLRNTGKAGVKIAGVKAQLEKIASQGCTCNGKGECQYDVMMAKVANMDGQNPMANAGEGHDGCTCGHTGECRVCKLQAAMHSARGGAPAGGV